MHDSRTLISLNSQGLTRLKSQIGEFDSKTVDSIRRRYRQFYKASEPQRKAPVYNTIARLIHRASEKCVSLETATSVFRVYGLTIEPADYEECKKLDDPKDQRESSFADEPTSTLFEREWKGETVMNENHVVGSLIQETEAPDSLHPSPVKQTLALLRQLTDGEFAEVVVEMEASDAIPRKESPQIQRTELVNWAMSRRLIAELFETTHAKIKSRPVNPL